MAVVSLAAREGEDTLVLGAALNYEQWLRTQPMVIRLLHVLHLSREGMDAKRQRCSNVICP